jgi:glycosyltransferase involved in cell wall biosynthesis
MDSLKILIGNNTLSLLAGSETWVYTLALQLKKMGHKVHCFSPELGIISEKLKEEGIPCFNQVSTSGVKPFSIILEEEMDQDYDVIIANHNNIVEFLRAQYPKKPIISTIHGIMHTVDDGRGNEIKAPEFPALESGVNQFVAVSEEVQELLQSKYNIDSIIIRNFLDTNHFKARKQIHPKPKKILFNSNYNNAQDLETQVIRDVAKHYGAKLIAIGEGFVPTFETMKMIEDADIVVGMGRSVLEGVCAGRLGIVHGRWGTGGVIREDNIEELRKYNFSGRNSEGKFFTPEEMIEEIDKYYNKETIEWGKNYIRRDHNVIFGAEAFVNIARELLGQNIVAQSNVDGRRPYRRARDVQRTA